MILPGLHWLPWLLACAATACVRLVWAAAADARKFNSGAAVSTKRQSRALAPLMRLEHASLSAEDIADSSTHAKDSHFSSVRVHGQGPEDEPLEHQMAQLAKETYYVSTSTEPVAGWTLEVQWNTPSYWIKGTDYLALWRKDDNCALVFAPTSQLEVWTSQSQEHIDSRDCGLGKVHKGFFNEFQEMVGEAHWGTAFVPTLTSSQCAGGLFAVGHGFGGALATIYAACAAKQKHLKTSGIAIPALFVDGNLHKPDYFANLPPTIGLFTYGAPGVSHEQIRSASAKDGTFAGARFYVEDEEIFDVTPFSGSVMGWIHPKLAAVRLKQEKSGWVNRIEFMAATDSAMKEPVTQKNPNPALHSANKYIDRLLVAPVLSGISRPGSSAVAAPVVREDTSTTMAQSTAYGVSGNETGIPSDDDDHLYVEPDPVNVTDIENCAVATSFYLAGAVLVTHAVEGLF